MNKEDEFINQINAHRKIIYKVCLLYANDKEDLTDLYQETILNLWKSFTLFEKKCSFSTWAYRIALNTCITYLRKNKRKSENLPITEVIDELVDDNLRSEQIKELYNLIKRLNKLERMYIMLWLDEKSYDEIAEIVGTNRNQVATRIHRIKIKLKDMSNF